jgi:adenylate cyclase
LTEERLELRLAAVLAADVAGFSRLSGTDEEGVLARLRALRAEVINPEVVAHNGRVFKHTGDAFSLNFVALSRQPGARSKSSAHPRAATQAFPPNRRHDFRIGIHLGDVVVEADGDLMGDGIISPSASRASRQWAAFRSLMPPTSRFATDSTLPLPTAAKGC